MSSMSARDNAQNPLLPKIFRNHGRNPQTLFFWVTVISRDFGESVLEAPINIEILHYNIKFYILLYNVDRGGSEWKMGGTRSEVWHFIFSLLWETVGTLAPKVHERCIAKPSYDQKLYICRYIIFMKIM